MSKTVDPLGCPSCSGGDPWSGTICDDCHREALLRKDLQEFMVTFIFHKNRIKGEVPSSLIENAMIAARNITRVLEEIKIDIKAYQK